MSKQRKNAFTLIELLVVISIISILISILLPALGAAKKSARAMQCLTLVKQFAAVNFMYAGDHHGWYVPLRNYTYADESYWTKSKYFQQSLNARKPVNGASVYWTASFACPDAELAKETLDSEGRVNIGHAYGLNVTWNSSFSFPPHKIINGQDLRVITQMDLDQLDISKKIMFADCTKDWQINGRRVSYWEGTDALTEAKWPTTSISAKMSFRHNNGKGMNASFYDGHAQAVRPEDALNNVDMWALQPD